METQGSGEVYEGPRRIKPSEGQVSRDGPLPPPQRCPRCQSENTKFSYFNNYNASQPRYFCKACRRYWTHGGSLRNVPVGGGSRNNKRRRASSSSSSDNGGMGEGQRARVVNLPIQQRPPQNLIGLANNRIFGNQSQPVRAMPPPMENFYPHGRFMSTLAPMHSQLNQPLQMINQVPMDLDGSNHMGGGGGGDDSTMALLQGSFDLSAAQVQHQNEGFQRQQFVVQNLVGTATASTSNTNLWSSPSTSIVAAPNVDGIGSSINSNQFPDNLPGFNPTI